MSDTNRGPGEQATESGELGHVVDDLEEGVIEERKQQGRPGNADDRDDTPEVDDDDDAPA